MTPTWLSHHRYIPLRHASLLRTTLCLLVFLGIFQWSGSTMTSNSPSAANDYGPPPDTSYPPRAGKLGDFGASPVIQKPSHGRIVVTGGGGNIGKPLVQRLLASGKPVTILDKLFYPDELDSLSSSLSYPRSYTSKSPLLKVHIGDIRNTTLLSEIFTSDVVGVVHLAAVSRVLWCLENEADCWDVNERGTQSVLDALTNLNAKDSGKRWFVLASSREVYGNPLRDRPTTEDMERIPANVYGASKLAAENVVTKHLDALNIRRAPGTLHVIALRLSNIYGGVYDHLERLIPSITTQALSHQVIQISGGQQNLDLVHIDDCVEAFLLAVAQLAKSISPWSPSVLPFSSRTSFEAYNVASGDSAKASSVISTILHLTRSQSPLQTITGDTRFPNVYRGSTVKASTGLGFKAKVGVKEGLGRFVKAYMRRTSTFLEEKIRNSCGPRTPTTATAGAALEPEEEIMSMDNVPLHFVVNNQQLDKLNGCSAHIVMNIDGELASLGPSPESHNSVWTATRDMPPFRFYTSTSRHSSRDGSENVLIRIRDQHRYYVGLQDPLPAVGPVAIERIPGDEVENGNVKAPLRGHALRITIDWEMRADAESSTVRLFVPGTNLQLVPTFIGGNFTIVESNAVVGEQHGGVGPFRITPLCCPSPAPWPFVADDPIDFTIEYQRTSLARPFLASPAKALCLRLQRALRKIKTETASLPAVELQYPALHSRLGIDVVPQKNWTSRATEWSKAELPACSNICDHPTICVDTGDCQCVLSSCSPRVRFPFSSYANLPVLSYPPTGAGKSGTEERESLVDMMKRSSWRNVLRAQASRLISVNTSLAQIYVAPVSESDRLFRENWTDEGGNKKDIGALGETHCMSADAQMEKALERMHVEPQAAEMTWGICKMQGDNRLDNTYDHARKNTPGFDSSHVVVPFTHHWGQCLAFEGTVWALREKVGLRVDSVVRSSTAWSVIGDLNSPCYRPHQDVVIPPRTCLSRHLWDSFRDMRNVKPARDRPVLVAFRGTPSGTGMLHGARLQCHRNENWHETVPGHRLHPDSPVLATIWGTVNSAGDYDYVENAIFCPQPAGINGWSAHLASSIYAGCIPVLIGEVSHYPFFDVIDWGKISVRVDINDLSHLEEVLLSRYTLDDIEQLQTNLMLVRNAFMYPLDNTPEEDAQNHMLEERGPLFFALQSTKLKLLTKWPTTDVYDRP